MTEIANEELIPHGAEETLNFAFGGIISNGCVNEDGAESGTDESEFLGYIVGAVIDIDRFGEAAFVKSSLEAVDEVGGVVRGVKGSVGMTREASSMKQMR